jgi:D-alanyl-D-alanine dipeptidase
MSVDKIIRLPYPHGMTPFDEKLAWIESNFVELQNSDHVFLDLKYASTDNFIKQNVYGGFSRCFLAPKAAAMFAQACDTLRKRHPDLQFRIWDALRPRRVQSIFYEHLRGTPFQSYVAAPLPGSLHNFGMALDLTLQKRSGPLLDMGTDFDDFRDLAQPRLEEELQKNGALSPEQVRNRRLLRGVLQEAGFRVLPHEWWHFNALPAEQVHGLYPSLD